MKTFDEREYARQYYQKRKTELKARAHTHYHANRASCLASQKAYRLAHKDQIRKAARVQQIKAAPKLSIYFKNYYRANREKLLAYQLEYARLHPLKINARNHAYRARKRNAHGASYTKEDHIAKRWAMWGGQCYICGAKATDTDHVKPLSKGGSHWPSNLRPICDHCNSSKKDQWPLPANFFSASAMRSSMVF